MPTIFFRFNRCNIQPKCYYCDTEFSENNIKSFEEFNKKIITIVKNNIIRQICFTGGEPLLFIEHIKSILNFLHEMINYYYPIVEIETNGLLPLPECSEILNCYEVCYIITPKLEKMNRYRNVFINEQFEQRRIIFKFMVHSDIGQLLFDLTQIQVFREFNMVGQYPFYLSPINDSTDVQSIINNYTLLLQNMNELYRDICNDLFFLNTNRFLGLSIQLHKVLEMK